MNWVVVFKGFKFWFGELEDACEFMDLTRRFPSESRQSVDR